MNTLSPHGPLISFETWAAALASSACIGFTSLVPWLFNLTFFEKRTVGPAQQDGQDGGDRQMKYLLGFAIGAILGDIFFHLIPESIESHLTELGNPLEVAERNVGVSIIAGIFLFIIVEMVLQKWSGHEAEEVPILSQGPDLKQTPPRGKLVSERNNNNDDLAIDKNGSSIRHTGDREPMTEYSDQMNNNNNNCFESMEDQNLIHRKLQNSTADLNDQKLRPTRDTTKESTTVKAMAIDPAGYLNLIANGFDNFTHGLAIGASFLVGMKVGVLTTFVIFIHEIPHEICDYAILVKSGFSRWEAVKAQSSVSLFTIMGTAIALYVKSVDKLHAKTVWILPFSAGGFLYIALVTLLPDILDRESNSRNSLGQIASVILGIAFMGLVALL